MQLHHSANLQAYHTFNIQESCKWLAIVNSVDEIIRIYQNDELKKEPKLVLGKGSNVLFTEPYQGLVIINRLSGIDHTEDMHHHFLHIAGGEDWPALVDWCIAHRIAGLENLALIPGCAGSAPIQNIGAYGVEFKDVCQYVDYLCLKTFRIKRLSRSECQFGYRDSIFKHALSNKAIIIAVGLMLSKSWTPNLSYGPLKSLPADCSADDIYRLVCQVRKEKLPDPRESGNAGSFFKNPIISLERYHQLKRQFPEMVAHPTNDGMKVAAGWLIDQAGLKGSRVGGAQVHTKQALVIVNIANATSDDVIQLATKVCHDVFEKFGIDLEHEVRFMGAREEVKLSEWSGNNK
ncbi:MULTISPECIES: UDP-N-acetylmuramate dehydrogenase [unclassified Vibrio]|uniref:UDP-N-acetylmuramate dehydrogenase n=2 Tax=Vibrio TaxID=662 RepID=UPI0014830743|nr:MULTISPECIES: UDP-N-acetylmuramate dehydrogenase [unclassified Vibrio]NNN46246.1 UDP-N-acetylmuramate dehydrogenase [Vibrio sp. 1-1(7)]NNN74126.1 UDP-N-acetylmuramate dehydrogenase [Vibrio sp. 12-2(3-a)]